MDSYQAQATTYLLIILTLMHEVHYVEGGYYTEWWQEDERGNVTDYEGRSASDRIHYVYDEDNHVIQEWGHNDNSYPKSVTIYDDYDEHGNYRYSRWIANMGNYSLIKDGGTWYDLDSIDSMPDHYSTYYYNYEYDDAGRLLKVERANYDGSSKSTHLYEYDEKGNLIFEKDSTYTYIREYYSNGIIAKQTKFFSSSKEVVEDISYDMHGNPISFTNDNGTTTTYQNEYDEHGNLVRQFTFNSEGKCKTYDIWRYNDDALLDSDGISWCFCFCCELPARKKNLQTEIRRAKHCLFTKAG